MSTILVHLWGYKSKGLPEAVNTLISNQSGTNTLVISIFDQTNLSREDKFPDYTMYNHVMWDSMKSPYTHLYDSASRTEYDYILYVEGAKRFEKNWDIELTMGHGGRDVVISGNHAIRFVEEYKFYPAYVKQKTETAIITNWITQDFFFMSKSQFEKFPNVDKLKYCGLEDVFSLYAAENGIPVQCIASAWVSDLDGGILSSDYIPFSIKHGYDYVTDIYKKKSNVFFETTSCVDKLSRLIGFDLSRLEYLPFPHDDCSYDPQMEMDNMGAERFLNGIRKIQ